MEFLKRLLGRRRLRLAQFDLPTLEFDRLSEMLLSEPLDSSVPPSNVVQLPRTSPTAGELHASIERYLNPNGDDGAAADAASPADELNTALAELRASLG